MGFQASADFVLGGVFIGRVALIFWVAGISYTDFAAKFRQISRR